MFAHQTADMEQEQKNQNGFKNDMMDLPYICFVEASGLLVVISYTGYCCKFSIEPQ